MAGRGATTDEPTRDAIGRRWAWEVLLLLSVAFTIWMVLYRSRMPLEYPLNSGWLEYTRMADYIWRPGPSRYYNDWRKPMFHYLLGLFSKRITGLDYATVGFAFARASMVVIVLSAALAARALAGRWAACLAVLTLPGISTLLESVHWISPYPMVAATISLTIALGSWLGRRAPRVWLAAALGLCAGLSWSLDHRGLLAVLIGAGCVLVSIRREHKLRSLLVIASFSLCTATMHFVDIEMADRFDMHYLSFEEEVSAQHRFILEHIQTQRDQLVQPGDPMTRACQDVEGGTPTLTALLTPCAVAMIGMNYAVLAPGSLPTVPFLLLFPLLLLPAAWGKRSVLTTVFVFGGALGSFLVSSAWVMFFERYVLYLVVPSALLAPLALYRLSEQISSRLHVRHRWVPHAISAVCVALLLLLVWPGYRSPAASRPDFTDPNTRTEDVFRFIAESASQLEDGDLMIDCTDTGLDALLPHALPYSAYERHSDECALAVREPPPTAGAVWVFLPNVQAGARWSPSDESLKQLGYESIVDWLESSSEDHNPTLRVWRKPGGW